MNNNILKWLMDWYESNCDGDWEHSFGIKIETLDNPGWYLEIDLFDTLYKNIIFNKITIERTDTDWIRCQKKEEKIKCAGGPQNLEEMLTIIKQWMEDNKPD